MGGENRSSRYWMKAEEKLCRLCKVEEETREHIFEKCIYTKKEGKKWEERLNGKMENLATLHQIRWMRKRQEEKEKERNTENQNR